MTAVVIGASSGLGRALSVELARTGHAVLLVASDARDLAALAADLQLRHGVQVGTLALDLAVAADPGARVMEALAGLPTIRALLLPVGMSRSDDDGSLGPAAIGQLLAINLHAPIAVAHALLPALLESRAAIVGFGSIAGARGRSRNIVYAAAKRGLETFFESLRHRHLPTALRVQFYRLGFLRSNLTFGMKLPLPAAEPEVVARKVIAGLRKGSFDRYQPRWWGMIALIVRCLPWFAFRRMKD
ncbi:MAG TPA: SDR family NAD(P)-dependent oxidoreductase [Dokdonella sp.]|uniref:SDR family NAD(P)-dependent oxidoreductase n=1 Tax=Dokdonella sp. TaxID=2291710 RepID=UPI002BE78831|nr:SDR family NAD(P)-dependent oxidoreductase [Dokdonella sp.]HOX72476.1 SDR family NAD(P)-dependent oxidoreductase [Dokdonella sp.]HPG92987.1 SDR family NAD(P)-dependent oxidoreductase [Dokdonella sp.]HPN80033.1 SDR family NAD(P)-dependent oxidoreductase [Dokdonella sp.]